MAARNFLNLKIFVSAGMNYAHSCVPTVVEKDRLGSTYIIYIHL